MNEPFINNDFPNRVWEVLDQDGRLDSVYLGNCGDVKHHTKWAIASNSIWFIAQIFIWSSIWSAINTGQWWQILVAGVVYTAATTFGSVWMMARMLKTEKGKQRVGAR